MKSPHTKKYTLAIPASQPANQKLQESIFFSSPNRIIKFFSPPLQKKIKSLQRTVQTLTDIASNVNRFEQSFVRTLTDKSSDKKSGDTHNKGLNESGGAVLRRTVFRIFELWCFVESKVLKCPAFVKPRTVMRNNFGDRASSNFLTSIIFI